MKTRHALRGMLSIVLIVSMVFASVVFAAKESDKPEKYREIGNVLKDLGLISGSGKSGDLNEKGFLTREEAIVILLRLQKDGKIIDEIKKRDPQGKGIFVDVPKGHWAIRYIEYAKENGITSGIGAGKFGLGNRITKKEFVTLLLRQMNYQTDWKKGNALEVAKECGMMNETDGLSDEIVRGQAFTYMFNALFVKPNHEDHVLFHQLGLRSSASVFAELGQSASNPKPSDKAPVVIDFRDYPKLVKASSYQYSEFTVEFNKPVKASKSNFKFTVEGREIPDDMIRFTAGTGEQVFQKVIFQFKEQNLHGKEVICTVSDIVDTKGNPMLGRAKISAMFKDGPSLYFKEAKVLNDKTVEFYMSERYQKPQYGQPYGYKVFLNGNELSEANKDYKMGWGVGNVFKVVFPEPKKEGKLAFRAWGWLELNTKKYMEEVEAEVDLADRELKEFPEPEAVPSKDTEIAYDFDRNVLDIIESEFNPTTDVAATTGASHTNDTQAMTDWNTLPIASSAISETVSSIPPEISSGYYTETSADIATSSDFMTTSDSATILDSTTVADTPSCDPAMLYTHYVTGKEAVFFTTKPLRSVDGIMMEMSDGTKYSLEGTFTDGITGFTVRLPENSIHLGMRDAFIGAKLHVQTMVEAECGAVTEPFIYLLDSKIN